MSAAVSPAPSPAAASSIATTTATATSASTMMSVLPSPSIQMARSLVNISTDQVADMSAYDLFQKQLESGSTEAAVDAMKRLGVVAHMAGAHTVVHDLLPYLTQLLVASTTTTGGSSSGSGNSNGNSSGNTGGHVSAPPLLLLSDELMLLLGQQLIAVSAVVPNVDDLVHFLPLLERLAAVEETVVRDQAVAVVAHVCDRTAEEYGARGATQTTATTTRTASGGGGGGISPHAATYLAVGKRLAAADWFTAKVSSAGMVPALLRLVQPPTSSSTTTSSSSTPAPSSAQYELLTLYKELGSDDTPMVRRAAAKHLGPCLSAAGWAQRDFGAAQVTVLAHDEQDSVRQLAVAALAEAGPTFGEHPVWTVQHWLPILKDGSTDMSWRVRNNLAKNFSQVANVLGIQGKRDYQEQQSLVMACFVAMLTDAEAEVRAAATAHLARMVAWGGPTHFATHVQPLLPALADDVVMEVRSKCALAVMDAAHGGTLDDATILQAFGPLLESFLQDEFHEVQLQVLSNLHKVAHLLPGLGGVVTALLQMSKATNWRVRQAVAQLLPHLAEARGLDFFSTVLLEPAWLPLLLDPVACVRTSTVDGMALLVRTTGQDFLLDTLLPQHVRIYNQNSNTYLIRSTILRLHIETAVESKAGPLWQEVVQQILRGLHDKVPNVRMVAADGLARIVVGQTGGGEENAVVSAKIRPALEQQLEADEDEDCQQACRAALDAIVE